MTNKDCPFVANSGVPSTQACAFVIGKKYRTRSTGDVVSCLVVGKRRVVFEMENGYETYSVRHNGRMYTREECCCDVLPEEVREPLKWEGESFVRVNSEEYRAMVVDVPEEFTNKRVKVTIEEILE